MKNTIKNILIVGAIAALGTTGYYVNEVSSTTKIKETIKITTAAVVETLEAPAPSRAIEPHITISDIPVIQPAPKEQVKTTKITLEKSNTYVFSGPVTQVSVGKAIYEIGEMDVNLAPSKDIFLFLDTPGGSVLDGIQFIDYINSLDRDVHTVTLFAASMGFQIVQNLDTRYVVGDAGILMSHRASLQGLGGQIYGELETRYNMIKNMVDLLDDKASARMQISVEDYRKLIVHEYWTMGELAVADRAADERAQVVCGKSLAGTQEVEGSFMGIKFVVIMPACPLARTILDTKVLRSGKFGNSNPTSQELVLIKDYFNSKVFFEKYIRTGATL